MIWPAREGEMNHLCYTGLTIVVSAEEVVIGGGEGVGVQGLGCSFG